MNFLNTIIPKPTFSLWESYTAKQEMGLKKEASVELSKFITELKQLDSIVLTKVVYAFTDAHNQEVFKIDFCLFQEILFPVLLKEVKNNALTANRRLAQFDQFLLTNQKMFQLLKQEINYQNDYFDPIDFYKKELEINSKDIIAIEGYLTKMAIRLNHYTHEYPEFGLLCDKETFLATLTNFKKTVPLSNKKEKWYNYINHWESIV